MKARNGWQLTAWGGNPSLGLKCWRKRFGKGHVSVGIGSFDLIVYSYGPNSDDSMSSTRKRGGDTISELEAMDEVDRNGGRYNSRRPRVRKPLTKTEE